jgi:hypothetical protein
VRVTAIRHTHRWHMSTFLGYVIVAALIVAAYFRIKRRRRARNAEKPWPYIRGTELHRRSLENINVAPFVRQAQGLPLYHDESQWRDPPG